VSRWVGREKREGVGNVVVVVRGERKRKRRKRKGESGDPSQFQDSD